MNDKVVKIGCGQGFWGDWLDAPLRLVDKAKIDYLVLDYLAEVTMSILAKQKERNPNLGFARDFPNVVKHLAPFILHGKLKIIANAGGLNPEACAEACIKIFKDETTGVSRMPRIAIVKGDDIFPDLDHLQSQGEAFDHLETNEKLESVKPRLKSMNIYLGAEAISNALADGAEIIITGRVADPCLTLGALAHEFQWDYKNWDLIASGIVAGHIIECGSQATGGNFSAGWQEVVDPWDIGFPIVECKADGSFVVTKPEESGGIVNIQTVSEQLVYEIGNPKEYLTPDVVVDFTSLSLEQIAPNRVLVKGAKGKPRPETLKISASFFDGYSAEGTLVLVGPEVKKKASICEKMIRERLSKCQIKFTDLHFEYLGTFDCIPGMSEKLLYPEPGEILFRVAIRTKEKTDAERFTREIAPLVLSGPSGITGYSGGKREVKEVFAYWPTIIKREHTQSRWEFVA